MVAPQIHISHRLKSITDISQNYFYMEWVYIGYEINMNAYRCDFLTCQNVNLNMYFQSFNVLILIDVHVDSSMLM